MVIQSYNAISQLIQKYTGSKSSKVDTENSKPFAQTPAVEKTSNDKVTISKEAEIQTDKHIDKIAKIMEHAEKKTEKFFDKMGRKIERAFNHLNNKITKYMKHFSSKVEKAVDRFHSKIEKVMNDPDKNIEEVQEYQDRQFDKMSSKIERAFNRMSKKIIKSMDRFSNKIEKTVEHYGNKIGKILKHMFSKIDNIMKHHAEEIAPEKTEQINQDQLADTKSMPLPINENSVAGININSFTEIKMVSEQSGFFVQNNGIEAYYNKSELDIVRQVSLKA